MTWVHVFLRMFSTGKVGGLCFAESDNAVDDGPFDNDMSDFSITTVYNTYKQDIIGNITQLWCDKMSLEASQVEFKVGLKMAVLPLMLLLLMIFQKIDDGGSEIDPIKC